MARAFGICEEAVIFPNCYTRIQGGTAQLLRRTLSTTPKTELAEAVNDLGETIDGQFQAAARGSHFFLWTRSALYEMEST
jgi:hypothetical protein